MADQGANKAISMISAALSVLGLLFLVSVFAGIWNYSVGPTIFIVSGISGVAGALGGFIARRSGANSLNSSGLWLGVLVVVAVVLLSMFYTFEAA